MSKLKKLFIILSSLFLVSMSFAGTQDILKFGTDVAIADGVHVSTVVAIGGDVRVNGTVDNDVVSIGGSIVLEKKARVNGNVISVGGTVIRKKGARVKDKIIETSPADISAMINSIPASQSTDLFHVFKIFRLVGFIALALLIVALFPRQIGLVSLRIEVDPLKTFFWGVLGILLIVPVAVLLIISVAGIMLIPLEIAIVTCAFIFAYVAFSQLIGKKLAATLKKLNLPIIIETCIGIGVLFCLSFIPVIGALVVMIGNIVGFGSIIMTVMQARRAT